MSKEYSREDRIKKDEEELEQLLKQQKVMKRKLQSKNLKKQNLKAQKKKHLKRYSDLHNISNSKRKILKKKLLV